MRANQPIEPSPRLVIEWNVADGVEQEVDRAFMEKVLTEALVDRKPAGPLELSLTVTTDEEIQELNRRYREVDSPTDVLSFPMLDFEHPEEPASLFPLPPGEPLALGDLVVSYPRATEQAQQYGHSPQREMAFLLVHGLMHLLGYDHENPTDQEVMRREEEAVLGRLNLGR